MTRPILLAAALATIALASCKGSEEPAAEQTGAPIAAMTEPAMTATPRATPAPSPNEPVDTAAPTAIPSGIQGTWGMNEADCDTSRADAKGYVKIGPKKLEFYESVAMLGTVKEREATRIRGTFAFEGEGQTWTQDMVLDVQDGGRRLVRRDYGPDAIPGPLQYLRCG